MIAIWWYLVLGVVLIGISIGSGLIRRLPLTSSLLYLAIGYLLGPKGAEMFNVHPLQDAAMLERLTEIAVIISLFSAGMKLRVPLRDRLWSEPVRLAFVSMSITVGLIALVGVYVFDFPLGAAILLGAVLAPTDPVLASDVQVSHPGDRDRLRFTLTGEAGLNDGTAFPFVMLGLGLLGLREIGVWGWRWLAIDVFWAIAGGLLIGWFLGLGVSKLIEWMKRRREDLDLLEDFLAVGLIALSYGVALLLQTYGFLAVFAAGLALRRLESDRSKAQVEAPDREFANTAHAVLRFNEQAERIAEVVVVILVGGMLSIGYLPFGLLWFAPFVFLVVRPISVAVGLAGLDVSGRRRGMISWFGIRGIGSIYYLMHAIQHGLPEEYAAKITALVLSIVAISVMIHGITVTPMMRSYERGTRAEEEVEAESAREAGL
ncbi:MAG: cation:proton antiporter [Thermoanaerobaculia bacterium]